MKIFTKSYGKGENIVLIHGWGACTHKSVMPMVEMLQNDYCVTVIDLPGRGQSEWSDMISDIPTMAEMILPALPEKAIYIGWSFGGVVSMCIAASHPERVKQLLCIGSSPKFTQTDDYWPGVPAPGFQVNFKEVSQDPDAFFRAMCDAELQGMDRADERAQVMFDTLIDDCSRTEIMFEGVLMVDRVDIRESFKKIQCPIDMLYGEIDQVVPASQYPLVRALNPRARTYVVYGARHFPFFTHKEGVRKFFDIALSEPRVD